MDENCVVPEEYPCDQANNQIPFDLFVSKKHNSLVREGILGFTDSLGNLVYKVEHPSHKSTGQSHCVKLLVDASDNTLFYIHRTNKGQWQGFRGNDSGNDLMFEVQRTKDEFSQSEFEILLLDENSEDSKTELKMIGSPFQRSCTIYKGNSIVAESSLMYKLGIKKVFVPRSRFRVTIFPGYTDRNLVVALVVIFFDGRKLWI